MRESDVTKAAQRKLGERRDRALWAVSERCAAHWRKEGAGVNAGVRCYHRDTLWGSGGFQ